MTQADGKAESPRFIEEFQGQKDGTRGEGRTLNLRLRRPTLYPIELLAQVGGQPIPPPGQRQGTRIGRLRLGRATDCFLIKEKP